jgi:hypothetical protein
VGVWRSGVASRRRTTAAAVAGEAWAKSAFRRGRRPVHFYWNPRATQIESPHPRLVKAPNGLGRFGDKLVVNFLEVTVDKRVATPLQAIKNRPNIRVSERVEIIGIGVAALKEDAVKTIQP